MNTASIPQIYVTVATGAAYQSLATSQKSQKSPMNISSIDSTRENIRERLNLHVKRRIQGQDTSPTSTLPISPTSSHLLMQKTDKFMNSGMDGNSPVVVFNNSLIKIAPGGNPAHMNATSMLPNENLMSISSPQSAMSEYKKVKIEKKPITKLNTLSNKSKKYSSNKKQLINQQAVNKMSQSAHTVENLLLNGNPSSLSTIDAHKADMLGRSHRQDQLADNDSPPMNGNGDCSRDSFEKQENSKAANTPDILSMVLSIKKNALMHDPDVIRFISSIR